MDRYGYLLLRNALNESDVTLILNAYDGKVVQYENIKKFIDLVFLPTITNKISKFTQPKYQKFRFSDNNNSTDAAVVHRDCYNHTGIDKLPIFTALCYFDESEVEIHPGSHIETQTTIVSAYANKKRIKMEKGDILVFHATLLHRGVRFGEHKHRRLLQVFDIYPDDASYAKFSPLFRIASMPKNEIVQNAFVTIAKNHFVFDIYNYFHLLLVYYNLQYKLAMTEISPLEIKDKIVSYEASSSKTFKEVIAAPDKTNINIHCDPNIKIVPYGRAYLYAVVASLALFLMLHKKSTKKGKR